MNQCWTRESIQAREIVPIVLSDKMKLYLLLMSITEILASDCSAVISIWKSLGKSTSLDPSNDQNCCSGDIPGITCEGQNIIQMYVFID